MPDTKKENRFELGLCLAGAISAGAYTAGVMDFLLEALEQWRGAKERREDVPRHDVSIKVIAGASAGGMTGAMFASSLDEPFRNVRDLAENLSPARPNALYRAWVESVNIENLLGARDLGGGFVHSLLDSTVLTEMSEAFMHPPRNDPDYPPYIDPRLHLYLTVSNLRGVPYSIAFKGNGYGHPMSLHKDHLHFILGRDRPSFDSGDPLDDGWTWLNPRAGDSADWDTFRLAGLATGAFPLGLAHRVLKRPVDDYARRPWDVVKDVRESEGLVIENVKEERIAPTDQAGLACGGRWYEFVAVDGGLMDNEPLELARRALAGRELVNPRAARDACRAVLLIDPFPEAETESCDAVRAYEELDLLGVAGKMFSGLKNQARFKMEEIQLAQDPDCYSRFLIGPSREGRIGSEPHIACGTLSGFGGFFSKLFRQHDYQLGRRNCQKFLKDYLAVPLPEAVRNDVFKVDRDRLRAEVGSPNPVFSHEVDGTLMVPVIPLTGSAKEEARPIDWGQIPLERGRVAGLKPLIRKRLAGIADIYLSKAVKCGLGAWIAKRLVSLKYDDICDLAVQKVLDSFTAANLIR